MATARYLLGEMTDEERDRFEEHYFGCLECASDVRDGSAMIDAIRAGRAASVKRSSVLPWFVAAAAAIAVAFLGFQNADLRRAASPDVLPSYSLLTMGTRGGAAPTTITDPARPFALFLDIPPQPAFPYYRIEIRDSANRVRVSLPVSVNQARETITVYVPPHRLQSGKYSVVVVGDESGPISSAPLDVR